MSSARALLCLMVCLCLFGCGQPAPESKFDQDVEAYLQSAQRLVNYCREGQGDAVYRAELAQLVHLKAGLLPKTDSDRQVQQQLVEFHEHLATLSAVKGLADSLPPGVADYAKGQQESAERIEYCQQQIEKLAAD